MNTDRSLTNGRKDSICIQYFSVELPLGAKWSNIERWFDHAENQDDITGSIFDHRSVCTVYDAPDSILTTLKGFVM